MLLTIDVGNTNIVFGVFKEDKLLATWRIATDVNKTTDEYYIFINNILKRYKLAETDITGAIISCVVPPLVDLFDEVCNRYFNITLLVVGSGIKTGVRIIMDNPKEVGADRIVNAVAGHSMYSGPLIIIDMGTATTLDAISAEGDYLGGAIAPGIKIAAEALFEHTAKLPHVELHRPKQVIGKNTITAMQSGIMFGYIGLIEGIVTRMKQEMGGNVKVIATGGLATIISKESNLINAVEPDLTLVGLRLIYEINMQYTQRKKEEHA